MSPAQAAQVVGVSRWTIMRAIKTYKLKAKRDNKNHWCIASSDLDRWRTSTVRTVEVTHSMHAPETLVKVASLEVENGQLRERLLETQVDRDAWRELAQMQAKKRSLGTYLLTQEKRIK